MTEAAATPAPAHELPALLGVDLPVELVEQALVHRSYAYEHGGLPTNERLEFLGDAVLGLVVTDLLYRQHPDLAEGQLAKLRAAVVNSRALADVGRSLQLGRYVRLGRGEETSGGRDKSSILADTLEALIGAIYLSCGWASTAEAVRRLFAPLVADSALRGAGLDWKTSLQELAAADGAGPPEYVLEHSGPDHAKTFRATVFVGGVALGVGEGRSKKEAEQQAAERAFQALRSRTPGGEPTPTGGEI